MIRKCVCINEWQDKQYGNQMRVANATVNGGARCTSCGKDMVGDANTPKSKKQK